MWNTFLLAFIYVDDRVMLVVHLGPQRLVVWTRMLTRSKLLEEAWLCWQREIAVNRLLYNFCEKIVDFSDSETSSATVKHMIIWCLFKSK